MHRPTAKKMNPVVEYIKANINDLSEETLKVVDNAFVKQRKERGDLLLSQGDVCRNLYFLSDGICRSYSIKDGDEITTWFSFKNEFITSFTSFFPNEPSYENIEMLSDGVLYQISRHDFFRIRNQSIETERIINHFSLLYTIQLEKRLFTLQTYSAKEKYKLILQQEPHLIQLISNKYLASYLGITRETLSRIRSSIN